MSFAIETIAVGDELLGGQISDTNSTYVSGRLVEIGSKLSRTTVVADTLEETIASLKEASSRADFVVMFGGLGPTSDDKTAEAVAKLLNCSLVEDPVAKKHLMAWLELRKLPATAEGLKQVLYPSAANPLPNSVGAAPGFSFQWGRAQVFCLPGVPREMKAMFSDYVLPVIQKAIESRGAQARIERFVWRCYGITEANLQSLINPFEKRVSGGTYFGYRTRAPENDLILYYPGSQKAQLEPLIKEVTQALGELCFAHTSEEVQWWIAKEFERSKATLALAESCTGGTVSSLLTGNPGASNWLWGGTVVYQTAAKKTLLSVEVDEEQAVSKECSFHLANELRKRAGTDYAAAITGFLGPIQEPRNERLGLVYLCVIGPQGRLDREVRISGNLLRPEAQQIAAKHLLHLILQSLKSSSTLRRH